MSEPTYNYESWSLSVVPDPASFDGPAVGEPMVDFVATNLQGERVALSSYLGRPLVLETGSITCPLYADTVHAMNALAQRFPEVAWVMLYTNEAHPGERIGPHASFDDKADNARLNCDVNGERRDVLVDDLDGAAHCAYGGFPNMLYLIDADGTVLARGHWSDPGALEQALERLAKRLPVRDVRFRFRYPNPFRAVRTLIRAGLKALWEGSIEVPRFASWHRRERDRGWA